MSQSSDAQESDNVYFVDHESGAEMVRLLDQDRLFTEAVGGLLPELPDLSGINRILDVACGPGGWALDLAAAYPEKEVIGFDISHAMIEYARSQAQIRMLDNAHFEIMDILEPLDFPDQSFDLVNARWIAFLPKDKWFQFIRECVRITRPGGIIRLSENEQSVSTSAGIEKLQLMFTRSLYKAGQSFSPTGERLGIVPMLRRFLHDAGCQNVHNVAYAIDYSAGTPIHTGLYHDWKVAYPLLQPFFLKMGVATEAEIDEAYGQMLSEMLEDDFCGIYFL